MNLTDGKKILYLFLLFVMFAGIAATICTAFFDFKTVVIPLVADCEAEGRAIG